MENERWAYLLTGLWYPVPLVSADTETILGDLKIPTLAQLKGEINLEQIGVVIRRAFLTAKDRITKRTRCDDRDANARCVFWIKDGMRDDNFAQKFADAVISSLAVMDDLDLGAPLSIGISEDEIIEGMFQIPFIRIKDVIGTDGIGSPLYFAVMNSTGVSSGVMDYVWRAVPAVVQNEPLMNAAHFYKESIGQVWVPDDDVFEFMCDNSDAPTSQTDRARVESAYQNAFKAIEAVIGEPPKEKTSDKKKLRMRLLKVGINPDEMVGFELYEMKPGKEAIIKKILDMQHNRDKKVAHGKTNEPRNIGYCELKDKQALARYILACYINYINMINKQK